MTPYAQLMPTIWALHQHVSYGLYKGLQPPKSNLLYRASEVKQPVFELPQHMEPEWFQTTLLAALLSLGLDVVVHYKVNGNTYCSLYVESIRLAIYVPDPNESYKCSVKYRWRIWNHMRKTNPMIKVCICSPARPNKNPHWKTIWKLIESLSSRT